jgi:hypothetical protein
MADTFFAQRIGMGLHQPNDERRSIDRFRFIAGKAPSQNERKWLWIAGPMKLNRIVVADDPIASTLR